MLSEVNKQTNERMEGAVSSLEMELATIRTGRASPALIERLSVEYYGTPTPLMQLAGISVPEARTLLIKPYDASTLREIERAILVSDLGITPINDGKTIRLNLPPLTEERRVELAKIVRNRVEEARVAIRNVRRDAIKELRDYENEKLISEDELERAIDDIQKFTDKYIEEVEDTGDRKDKEIMEI